ncbi:MAG: cell envelope-related transcriptional attenuator [Acidimicrobiales bacterium]|nr:cell envelope-related transcriptional attenuator [Acidimicrobiales bacterium]
MTGLLLWLILGLALGVGAERLVYRVRNKGDLDAHGLGPRRRRSRKRIVVWSLVGLLALILVAGVGGWLWANSVFNKIQRVQAGSALRHGGGAGTNYLLVGTDNRPDPLVTGSRTDSMIVLRVQGGSVKMMSIPRDLWVTRADNNQKGKLNGAYNGGPKALIQTIAGNDLRIPIDRYMEINYTQFGDLVNAIGGINIDFLYPALDRGSGLVVNQTGSVHLDGTQALAFVRSRHYTSIINGQEVPDNQNDFGRQARQQMFMRAVLHKLAGTKNPLTLMSGATKLSHGLKIDEQMRLTDAMWLAWRMAGKSPETVKLPTKDAGLGGVAALSLVQPDAEAVLAPFRQ